MDRIFIGPAFCQSPTKVREYQGIVSSAMAWPAAAGGQACCRPVCFFAIHSGGPIDHVGKKAGMIGPAVPGGEPPRLGWVAYTPRVNSVLTFEAVPHRAKKTGTVAADHRSALRARTVRPTDPQGPNIIFTSCWPQNLLQPTLAWPTGHSWYCYQEPAAISTSLRLLFASLESWASTRRRATSRDRSRTILPSSRLPE